MKQLFINRRQLMISGAAVLASSKLTFAHNGMAHVTIKDLAFEPAEIQVKVGDVIEWINKDPFEHTATVKGGWEVMIPPGKTVTKTVTADDNVDYYCRFHPNMTGRIIVTG